PVDNVTVIRQTEMVITELHPLRADGADTMYKQVVLAPWSAPPPGWVKVNCDGAFSVMMGHF
ncbi:unnamed protein product, partial [Ilex paraguariensis]